MCRSVTFSHLQPQIAHLLIREVGPKWGIPAQIGLTKAPQGWSFRSLFPNWMVCVRLPFSSCWWVIPVMESQFLEHWRNTHF